MAMPKILGKVAGFGIDELAVAGVTKYFEERFLANIVGDANLVSGAVKLGIGMFLPKENKYIKSVALGFGIDGIEDILSTILGSGGIFGEGSVLGSIFGGNQQSNTI